MQWLWRGCGGTEGLLSLPRCFVLRVSLGWLLPLLRGKRYVPDDVASPCKLCPCAANHVRRQTAPVLSFQKTHQLAPAFLPCSRSEDCQRKAWRAHKAECARLVQRQREEAAGAGE